MKICVISGSRADAGLLQPVIDLLRADEYFDVEVFRISPPNFAGAYQDCADMFDDRPDMLLILGDRYEILAAAIAAHLQRIPIAHIGGGDVTLGSYDDAHRDCISRMATIHFATSEKSAQRLQLRAIEEELPVYLDDIHMVGSPGIDVIMRGEWKTGVPAIAKPYVVVNYQAETIDGTVDLRAVNEAIAGRKSLWIKPNPDAGNEKLPENARWNFSHHEYLNIIYHCDELIGNSSSLLYEAPFFDPPVKTRLIGKRQQGRVQPFGDGKASERIVEILKEWKP